MNLLHSGDGDAVDTYTVFMRMIGKSWSPPQYRFASKLPFILLESEIDCLIAGCSHREITFLQLFKETAIRSGEADKLMWTDVDFESI